MAKSDIEFKSELKTIYSNRFDAAEAYRNEVWKTLIAAHFQSFVPANAAVLDLGCGYGQFINNIRCAGKFAMDLNPTAREKLNPDVTLLMQDCAARWELPDSSLDLVFTSNFFEHLFTKAALSHTIAEAARCLKPGGRLIALGPNIKFTGGAYWDFFVHHLALTELSVREAFEMAGLEIESVIDRFLPYTMVNAPRYPPFFIRVYLAVPFIWKLLGKQFLVTAKKR